MKSLDKFAAGRLAALDVDGLRRSLAGTGRGPGARAGRDGAELISFSCNDYLDLSHHPKVKQAAKEAVAEYGAGAGASRLVTGNHPLYDRLEAALCRIKGTEDAIVFGSGYLCNLGVAPALVSEGDLIIADELVHSSLHAGIRASRAEALFFVHNDLDDCRRLLAAARARNHHCLILTEGVFSMDGDRAPLAELSALAGEYDGWLLVDDAHGFGVLGEGRGSAFDGPSPIEVPLQMGTLSKAVGSYGGFLCAAKPVVELMHSRARSFVYSTGLPPAAVAASIAALEIISTDKGLVAAPLARAESPIVPLIVGDVTETMSASRALADDGFLVSPIRPPTVPEGTARLRFAFSAAHREEDVARLADRVCDIGLAA